MHYNCQEKFSSTFRSRCHHRRYGTRIYLLGWLTSVFFAFVCTNSRSPGETISLWLDASFLCKAYLKILGQYDIDSKTVVCSRDGEVFILKKDAHKSEISQTRCHMKSHVLNVVKARNTVSFSFLFYKNNFWSWFLHAVIEHWYFVAWKGKGWMKSIWTKILLI